MQLFLSIFPCFPYFFLSTKSEGFITLNFILKKWIEALIIILEQESQPSNWKKNLESLGAWNSTLNCEALGSIFLGKGEILARWLVPSWPSFWTLTEKPASQLEESDESASSPILESVIFSPKMIISRLTLIIGTVHFIYFAENIKHTKF